MRFMEMVFGANPVLEVLRAGLRCCHEIFIFQGKRKSDSGVIIEEASKRRIPIRMLDKEELDSFTGNAVHQGVVARVDPYPYFTIDEICSAAEKKSQKGFLLVLDGITDPQNFGALIRTAHLMGVDGVITPRDNSSPVSGAAVKASAGATEYIMISQVTNLVQTLKKLKERNYWILGADGDAKEVLCEANLSEDNVAVVVGSEGRGIRRLVKATCDFIYKIPMVGKISSFNVSVAGAVFMWEIARSRYLKACKKYAQDL